MVQRTSSNAEGKTPCRAGCDSEMGIDLPQELRCAALHPAVESA